MAQRWRDTGGREGLPNVDFCGSYRVPVWALKKLVDDALAPKPAKNEVAAEPPAHDDAAREDRPVVEPTPLTKPTRARRQQSRDDQSALFDLPPAS